MKSLILLIHKFIAWVSVYLALIIVMSSCDFSNNEGGFQLQGPQRADEAEVLSRTESFLKKLNIEFAKLSCTTMPDPGWVTQYKQAACIFSVEKNSIELVQSKFNFDLGPSVINFKRSNDGLFEPYIPIKCGKLFQKLGMSVYEGHPRIEHGLGNSWYLRKVYFNKERDLFCLNVGAR